MELISSINKNQKLNLKKINIVCNTAGKNSQKIADVLMKLLEQNAQNFTQQNIVPNKHINFDKDATFVITIGGDGTLLSTARFYSNYNVPVLGLNFGHLGFLAQIDQKRLRLGLEEIINGNFIIQNRMMLEGTTSFSEQKYYALNDIVIKGGTISRTSRLYLSINGQEVCDYLADGIIISTPTGSTAYNLSANGPIISPELDAITITPISPHTLSVRPLVIKADEQIEVKTDKNSELIYLTADGQDSCQLDKKDKVSIHKSKTFASLVLLSSASNNFYSVLRRKLNWGIQNLKY